LACATHVAQVFLCCLLNVTHRLCSKSDRSDFFAERVSENTVHLHFKGELRRCAPDACPHGLKLFKTNEEMCCDGCEEDVDEGKWMFGCRECEHDQCLSCLEMKALETDGRAASMEEEGEAADDAKKGHVVLANAVGLDYPPELLARLLQPLEESALEILGSCVESKHVELSLVLCDDDTIRKYNLDIKNVDAPVDLLCCPQKFEGLPYIGDVFISLDRAKDQAKRNNREVRDEIHQLLRRGIKCLTGSDDGKQSD